MRLVLPPATTMDAPLPAISAALAPYIHPPVETTRIRQLLTAHLASLASQPRVSAASGSTSEFTHFLDLELGRSPSSSAYRSHLTALREHATAKRAFTAELNSTDYDEPADDEDDDGTTRAREDGPGDWKEHYLMALKLRRQHFRLSILREYITELSSSDALPAGALAGAYPHPPPAVPDVLTTAAVKHTETLAGEDEEGGAEAAVLDLQKRLVAAGAELRREEMRVAQAEARSGGGNRVEALARTRQALIEFIDAELSQVPAEEQEEAHSPTKTHEPPHQRTMDEVLTGISAAYDSYIASRSSLLVLLSAAPAPAPVVTPALPEQQGFVGLHLPAPTPAPEVLRVLSAAEQLLPLNRAQKALLAAQNYFAAAADQARKGLAEQFATDEVISAAEARASQVEKTMRVAQKDAKNKVAEAEKSLEQAKERVKQVEELAVVQRKKKSEIPVKGRRARKEELIVEEEGGGGLWDGLGGKVGVIGDGI